MYLQPASPSRTSVGSAGILPASAILVAAYFRLHHCLGGAMRTRIVAAFASTAFLLCIPARPQEAKLAAAAQQIEKRIAASHAEVAVAFRTLDAKSEYFFRAASTMKIPVMIELFHQVKEGKLRFDDPLVIHNEFHSIVDGSVFKLDPVVDSETDLYKAEGQTRTLRQLCDLMITVSSNLATNLMIEKLGVENIRAAVHSLDADGLHVLRGVEDQKAFDKGLNNTTTARALLQLLAAIAHRKAVDAESSRP